MHAQAHQQDLLSGMVWLQLRLQEGITSVLYVLPHTLCDLVQSPLQPIYIYSTTVQTVASLSALLAPTYTTLLDVKFCFCGSSWVL